MITALSIGIQIFIGLQFGWLAYVLWKKPGRVRFLALLPASVAGTALLSIIFATGVALGFSESLPFMVDLAYWFGIELPLQRIAEEIAKLLRLS